MDESAIKKRFGLVMMSPEILNPEFKVGTLYPNTFESGEFRNVNGSLTNPDIISACFLLLLSFGTPFLLYLKFFHG